MKVPQLSPWVGEEEYKAISSCFEENWITEGPKSKEFVEKILDMTGAKYGVLAPNGTLALYLALRSVGIGPGDEVLVPDFTFMGSATSIEMTGATPVFVDVNKKNFQVDISSASNALTKKTKAIMPVHIYGTICNMDEVMNFARENKLKVVEDAAEAIGVFWKGRHAGTFGDTGAFSFFADKTITTAEGGMIVTNDEKTYDELLYLRNQGRKNRGSFIHPRIGYNFRMTDLQTAMGLVQLGKFDEIKRRKEEIMNQYYKEFDGVEEIEFFEIEKGADWIPFRMPILYKYAHELMDFLRDNEIEPRTFFYPLHKQPCFEDIAKIQKSEDYKFTGSIYGYERGVCLPIFPTLTKSQVSYVCKKIKEFMVKKRDTFYKYYDVLFKEKDYARETSLVFSLSEKYGIKNPKNILEIGTGTGNHTKDLASREKVNVVAVDIDHTMVEIAKDKLKEQKNVTIRETRIEDLEDGNFDLAIALFNVVTYIKTFNELVSFFKGVSSHLSGGSIFVFDAWNGVAAMLDGPRVKVVDKVYRGKKIHSVLTPETDLVSQRTKIAYEISAKGKGDAEEGYFVFSQTLWTPQQIKDALTEAGMELVASSPLSDPDREITDKDWKVLFVSRK